MVALTQKLFIDYMVKLGYIPVTPITCVRKLNELIEKGEKNFEIYITPFNRCWYVDEQWKNLYFYSTRYGESIGGNIITLNVRDFILNSMGI